VERELLTDPLMTSLMVQISQNSLIVKIGASTKMSASFITFFGLERASKTLEEFFLISHKNKYLFTFFLLKFSEKPFGISS
jgi:hypothetical protein